MEEEEDVTTNPFFITLKQRHAGLYQLVQSKCYVVCVPQAASLAGTTLSEEFLSTPASSFVRLCTTAFGIRLINDAAAIDQFYSINCNLSCCRAPHSGVVAVLPGELYDFER